jgi:hypothetical protein
MLSLFPVACSKLGAIWSSAEVSATELNTLISAALPTVAPSEHNINPAAAVVAMRFANDVWIMHPSHEINSKLFDHRVGGAAKKAVGVVP